MAVTEDGHFLLQDAVAGHRWEPLTGRAAVGRLGDDEAFGHCELLDRAVVGTLCSRGHGYAVPAVEVPVAVASRSFLLLRGAAAVSAGMEEAC